MAKFNDIDMKNWKDYEDIQTDSLWLIAKRDNSGAHSGVYHGNFVPQIPNQLFRRYTKVGDWILDPFAGSGTSIIEARRLGRNIVGIELQENVARETYQRVMTEKNDASRGRIYIGDSCDFDINSIKDALNIPCFQFVIFHPPYWNIIKFSNERRDLSNAPTLEDFLNLLGKAINNVCSHLEKKRYCALVIGDKYENGEIVPLGFHYMNLFLQRGYQLKAIIVKNFEETKGKMHTRAIWRYRALASDFYLFKHEYVMVFKKV